MGSEHTPLLNNLQEDDVKDKNIGDPITLHWSCYLKVNHLIRQTRIYYPHCDLPCYIYARYIEYVVFFAFLASFVAFIGLYAIFFCLVSIVFCLALLAQHERVRQKSLSVVSQQVVFKWQRDYNTFYWVPRSHLQDCEQMPEGLIQVGNRVQFQALNNRAQEDIARVKYRSRLFFLLFLFVALPYNMVFLFLYFKDQLMFLNIGIVFMLS